MGMKIPLMNIKENLIRFDSIIISDGLSVGGADSSKPRDEKQKADRIVPMIKDKLIIFNPIRITPTNKIKLDIKRPNRTEAVTSPSIMAHKAIGAEISLSKVLMRVSHGAIIGDIAEEVKKIPMASKPGIKKTVDICLPTAKAIKRKDGRSRPNTATGPFK